MKTYKSSINGGLTVELSGVSDAVKIGRAFVEHTLAHWKAQDPDTKVKVSYKQRDESAPGKSKTLSIKSFVTKWESTLRDYDDCAENISTGLGSQKAAISELAQRIMHLAHLIEPSLSVKPMGFERGEEGFDLSPEAFLSGDDRPAIRRRVSFQPGSKQSGEAYRVIINTDVSWFGAADDNAGLIGGLVLCLQQFGPVEIWIQQGWLGGDSKDGVTLFKLDFNGAFDPTQLAFWVGHHNKDAVFSYCISRGLQRSGFGTSSEPEFAADLYLRGDWLKLHGIIESEFIQKPKEEQYQLMAKWVAATSLRMLGRNENN